MLRLKKNKRPPRTIIECMNCGLCTTRRNVVVGRGVGDYKNGLLFIGEAPEKTEDALGEPLIGDAGRLLSYMLSTAKISDYYITNTILCRPIDKLTNRNRVPFPGEVFCCRDNINSIISHVFPRAVCFIGKIAQSYYKGRLNIPEFKIIHPSSILRVGGSNSYLCADTVRKLISIKEAMDEIKVKT